MFPSSMPPAVAFRVLTTAVVGVAVLLLSDRLGATENPDDLAMDVLNVTIAGLQSGVPLRSKLDACVAEPAIEIKAS